MSDTATLLDPAHWIAWLRNPEAHVGMADRYLIAQLWERAIESEMAVREYANELLAEPHADWGGDTARAIGRNLERLLIAASPPSEGAR